MNGRAPQKSRSPLSGLVSGVAHRDTGEYISSCILTAFVARSPLLGHSSGSPSSLKPAFPTFFSEYILCERDAVG